MRVTFARVVEIQSGSSDDTYAWIACPQQSWPGPGQYVSAWSPAEVNAPLAVNLFPAGYTSGNANNKTLPAFLCAPPFPAAWAPGTELLLSHPLGHGFDLPAGCRRLALAALGSRASRLLPLAGQALAQDAAVALFTDALLPSLSTSIEVYPLSALPATLSWPDFLALDLPLQENPDLLQNLPQLLGLTENKILPCPAQALVAVSMPCNGIAECGVCAIPVRRGWKLACKHGPVFSLEELRF